MNPQPRRKVSLVGGVCSSPYIVSSQLLVRGLALWSQQETIFQGVGDANS